MADPQTVEQLSDLMPRARIDTVIDGQPLPTPPDTAKPQSRNIDEALKLAQTAKAQDDQAEAQEQLEGRDEIRLQFLSSLNGQLSISGIPVPQPATAVYALLSMIDSPFVTGQFGPQGLTELDVIKALYILVNREKSLDSLFVSTHASAQITKTQSIAEKSPEFYAAYLDAISVNAAGFARFEKECLKWSERLGTFDVTEVGQQIVEYVKLSHSGWDLFRQSDDAQSKKND